MDSGARCWRIAVRRTPQSHCRSWYLQHTDAAGDNITNVCIDDVDSAVRRACTAAHRGKAYRRCSGDDDETEQGAHECARGRTRWKMAKIGLHAKAGSVNGVCTDPACKYSAIETMVTDLLRKSLAQKCNLRAPRCVRKGRQGERNAQRTCR